MDSDSIIPESFDSRNMYSGRIWPYYQKYPMLLTYGLMALSYILILTLFIMVLSSSTNYSSTADSKVQTEIVSFKTNISGLSSKVIQLEKTAYKETCESSWLNFKSHCYFITSTKTNWMKARTTCISKGGDLVVITSQEEQLFLMSKVSYKTNRYWIGLSDMEDEGVWTWVDGTGYERSYKNWRKGEPNDFESNEDCAHVWLDGEWNDVHCTYENCFAICEKKLS
ncbi:hepatic lectin-like [Pelobates fuscus]|uniref:hepatic lectin-like n=1 Tax=Pelobates fuscus TaxID=191477 RepID=UPI002FE4F166